MKKVRFDCSSFASKPINMNDSECHSPRPLLGKQINSKPLDIAYQYHSGNPFASRVDPIQIFQSSNSSPYPEVKKTSVNNINETLQCQPSNELDLSFLDSDIKPRGRHLKYPFQLLDKDGRTKALNGIHECRPLQSQLIPSIENKPLQISRDSDFFIKRDNVEKFRDLNKRAIPDRICLEDKENSPTNEKAKIMKKLLLPDNKRHEKTIENMKCMHKYEHLEPLCKCCHCINVTKSQIPVFVNNPHFDHDTTQMETQICHKSCTCSTPLPQINKCGQCIHRLHQFHNNCHFKSPIPENAVEKKIWAIKRYEQNKYECTDIEKQTNIITEKKEPTVSDLFRIIKLQNEQLQMLQEKVDKFVAAKAMSTEQDIHPIGVQNTLTEHVALETINNKQKISIGVMTSFELVRTSTIINKEVVTETHENAQIQCNRSQISIKEVVSKTPVNPNFLDGIIPMGNTKSGLATSTKLFETVEPDNSQKYPDNEEKTLNEVSLCNVQVDNAITPLMSPDHSLHLDVRDYSDSDESIVDHSNVGWTYYNKVMNHVNGMLQDSDMPSSASALHRNTRQQCVQMQIDKTNISVTKRVKFGDDPLGILQPHIHTTDTSLKMNQLAAKYLKNGLPPALLHQAPKTINATADISFATRNYMERHRLLQELPPARVSPSADLPKFLDITALKQQPKLL